VAQGNAVTVICSRFPGSVDGYNEGIFYRHIGLGTSNIKLNNIAYFFALPFAVARLAVDVIIECFTAPISTCFTPLFTKTPVIGMPTMFEAKEFSKKYHLPFHWIEAIGSRLYRYFLAYSPLNKVKMERLNPYIITRIIPNGVDESLFTERTSRGDYAVFIGRIDIIQKGLDLLLEAIAKRRTQLPISFVIAGNGTKEDETKLKKIIAQKRLNGLVSFAGRVDGKEKIQLLANARFGIYASRFEDFPLVPLEFTALGKPMVSFDIPGLAWVSQDVSIKAKPFDADELGAALVKLSTDDKLLSKMEKYCRPFAEQYGWDNISKDYAGFCSKVLELEARRTKKRATRKKVVVLGGAGYIGSVLADYFHERGDEVTIFDNLLYEKKPRSFAPHRFIKGDIRDRGALESVIAESDCVVNLAALSNDPSSDLDPKLALEINYLSNEHIAEICKRHKKRVVFASSCSVYGFSERGIFNEDSNTGPVTLYAKTKALSEKFYSKSDIDAVILRLATVYGCSPKPRFDLVINTMIGRAYFEKQIVVHGGDQWRPLVHVKDVSHAIYLACHRKKIKHRVYNVGSNDQNYQINELARQIKQSFPTVTINNNPESVDGRSYHVNFNRIKKDFGYEALFTIKDAVSEFDEAFRTGKITGMVDDVYFRVKYLKSNSVLKTMEPLNMHELGSPLAYTYEN